mgnify:FL=1|tara:strand:- start:128 stop:352 length:225 start_codon:yes stop_codon:yes gene_type:complete
MQKVYQVNISGIIVTDDTEGDPRGWDAGELVETFAGYPEVEVHEMTLVKREEDDYERTTSIMDQLAEDLNPVGG